MDMRQILKKEETYTFFSNLCLRCAANYTCVAASRISLDRDTYLKSLHRIMLTTEEMKKGTEIHKKYSENIQTIQELGRDEYISRLKRGEKITVKELPVCLMLRNGYRGHIDIFSIQRREVDYNGYKTGEYMVTIQENKSTPGNREWRAKWMRQLAIYSLICLSPVANWIHIDENEWMPIYIDKEPIINIKSYLHFLSGSGYWAQDFPDFMFAVRNKIQEPWVPYIFGVLATARKRRALHRRGLYLLELPEEEPFQMFLGKRKTLIKTPPKLGVRKIHEF